MLVFLLTVLSGFIFYSLWNELSKCETERSILQPKIIQLQEAIESFRIKISYIIYGNMEYGLSKAEGLLLLKSLNTEVLRINLEQELDTNFTSYVSALKDKNECLIEKDRLLKSIDDLKIKASALEKEFTICNIERNQCNMERKELEHRQEP